MVMPPGHGELLAGRRPLTQRERWIATGVLAMLVPLAVVLAIAIGSGGRSSAAGCVYATIPGAVGAQEISQCGAQARATCRSVSVPGTFTAQAARVIEQQCRKAGLPVGG